MIKSFILLFMAAFIAAGTNAQSILLERDINESVYVKKKGPNKNRFIHLYYDYAYYTPDNGNQPYEFGYSFRSYAGLRNYYRLAQNYIMGVNLEFGWENFRIEQNNQKTFPSTGVHKKETLSTSNIGLEYFNRLLITQRENTLGLWVDAGIYGNLNLGSRHVTKDKSASTDEARYHKEINKGLKYLNQWEYGVKARIGIKRYALTGTYRLSDWISGTTNNYEPSRVSIGFELGLY